MRPFRQKGPHHFFSNIQLTPILHSVKVSATVPAVNELSRVSLKCAEHQTQGSF
jgi:hypothetical protein